MKKSMIYNLCCIFFAFICVISHITLINFGTTLQFQELGIVNIICKYTALLSLGCIVLGAFILMYKKTYTPSFYLILIMGLYIYLLLVLLLNGRDIIKIGLWANICMLLGYDIILYKKKSTIFRYFLNWYNFFVILNFCTILIYKSVPGILSIKDGVKYYSQYLLGYDNGHIIILLPVICINILLFFRYKKKYNLFIACCGIASIFITFSATSVICICMMFFLFGVYVSYPRISMKILNEKFWINAIAILSVVFFVFHGYEFFSEILLVLFNKNIESARVALYDIALSYIKKAWITGYGYVADPKWIMGYNSPHNVILNFLLAGGIIGLIWFLIIVYQTIKKGRTFSKKKECVFITCAVIAFVLASFAEGYDTYNTYYLFYCLCLSVMRWDNFEELLDNYYAGKIKIKF